ncbi:MAG TPA: aquaporin [Candidatus Saccharimonadales bacterium]|nr:aquaporin [Candidatus Saccharimonadales bacterium]
MAKATTKKPAVKAGSLRKELSLGALVAELLGGALLAFAALMTQNNPILGALAVVVGVLIFVEVSGAYLNPVVVVAAWAMKQISWIKAVGFIVVQVLGAMLAYVVITKLQSNGVFSLFTSPDQIKMIEQTYGSVAAATQAGVTVRAPGEWLPIWGEFVGAIIFGFGIASAVLGKKLGFDRAFTIGGALMLGLLVALAGGQAVLNPAVATAISAFSQGGMWSFAAYAIAPVVGGALGAWLFKLLKNDVDSSAKA